MSEILWDSIKSWTNQQADRYLFVVFTDKGGTRDEPLVAYQSYVRLWLCEMVLSHSRQWLRDWYPAVHSSVRVTFGGKESVTFNRVSSPPQHYRARGVYLNYPLSELIPFNGGIMEIESALLALQGDDVLDTIITILQKFSWLVAAPLDQALLVAEKVGDSIRDLMGATNGRIHLGFHHALTSAGGGGANVLIPGYIAVILASEKQVARERLAVVEDRLHYSPRAGALPSLFQGYDYFLLRVEVRQERDTWRLKPIEEPLNRATEALLRGEKRQAESYRKAALLAALHSPDLTVCDRRRVAQAIHDELTQVACGVLGEHHHHHQPAGTHSLDTLMMGQTMSLEQAAAMDEPTLAAWEAWLFA